MRNEECEMTEESAEPFDCATPGRRSGQVRNEECEIRNAKCEMEEGSANEVY